MRDNLLMAFEVQSQACASLGAMFSAGLLKQAERNVAAGGIVSRLLVQWNDVPTGQVIRDAVALRLLASLHYLVLSGGAPELAACYPPEADDPEHAWIMAERALDAHSDEVTLMLAHEPQTNEVRRSACLLGGFLAIGRETKLPLRCFELGASAGLNSLWDRFRYQIGDSAWGNPASTVILPCRWEGNAPGLDFALTVVERRACDRRPVDLREGADATRLLSYCWPEQRERMQRLRGAIALAEVSPVEVEAQQAVLWVGQAKPKSGAATVVFHSIVWQYIPPAEQAEIFATLQAHAAQATPDAPFFWLRMELNEAARQFELKLWTGEFQEDRLLAIVHPHGEFAKWQ
jgi:hypothetical protein